MSVTKRSLATVTALLVGILVPSMAYAGTIGSSPNALPGFHQYNYQNSTAYTSSSSSAVGSSGAVLRVGDVAVHYQNGQPANPVIPFGTQLNMLSPVDMAGAATAQGTMSTFFVEDTGSGTGYSTYWVDFYWGTTSANLQGAVLYGNNNLVSYTCYY